ncbi:MAG: Peptidase propeptide and domain [Micromonosporaceae bacterium]|jgi:hypothetical protein|nr:Peptidase propeptide and domain [Micromonosporaceae bacterium]
MRKSVVIAIGAAAIVVAVVSGVAATAAPRITEGGSPVPSTSAGPRVSVADAKQIALAAVPGSTVVQVESDDVQDRPVWKVVLATPNGRVAVSIDVATGQVLGNQPAESSDDAASPSATALDDGPAHDAGDDHGGDRVQTPGIQTPGVDDHGGDRGRGRGTDDGPLHD